MKKFFILLSTIVLSFSCFVFANTASARTQVSAFVIQRGYHHGPYWHRPYHRYPYWRRYHRHPRYY